MLQAKPTEVDFVIVGGGLAGLSAALTIGGENIQRAADDQLTFVVLESSDRIGGRTYSPDPALDFGGGYIGSTQTYVQYLRQRYAALKLLSPETPEFDLPTTSEYLPHDGWWLYEHTPGEPPSRFPGDNPLAFPGGANAIQLLGQVDAYALLVRNHLERPWESPLAAMFDGITVQDWIERQTDLYAKNLAAGMSPETAGGMSPETMAAFVASVRSAFSLEPSELSFFFLLYYSATAGTYSDIVDVAGGDGAAEATRFLYGTKSLIDAMAVEITPANIVLNAKVEQIEDGESGVTVTTSRGTWKAKRRADGSGGKVIVAMSPPVSSRIRYSPPFGDSIEGRERAALCNAMLPCSARTIKGFVQFKEAYWRDKDTDPEKGGPEGGQVRMGFMLSSANLNNDKKNNQLFKTYPLDWTLDNVWEAKPDDTTGPDGNPKQCYLMTFIVGDSATYWASQPLPARAHAVIEHVQRIYGLTDDELFDSSDIVSNYKEYNWPAGGAESTPPGTVLIPAPDAMMGPNTLSTLGWALRVPVGNIHWAGSESATEWNGYMNGAIQSGFRAAGEVLGFVRPLSRPSP